MKNSPIQNRHKYTNYHKYNILPVTVVKGFRLCALIRQDTDTYMYECKINDL